MRSVVLRLPFHCCQCCSDSFAAFIGILKFKTQRLFGVPTFLWKCDLFCLPDNKALPNKIRSRGEIMKRVTKYFLFHLKYQCAFTSQSFTVGPGHHLVSGANTCEGVLILVIWLHFYRGASLVLTSVITVTITTGINIFENKLKSCDYLAN